MKCPNCGAETPQESKFCSYCGSELPQPQKVDTHTVINNITYNINSADNSNASYGKAKKPQKVQAVIVTGHPKNKWVAFFLCLCTICGHKFYEGKTKMGLVYLFTCGLFGIGWLIDLIVLIFKPNPYYV
ncbi:MAG: NINE protein [Oscillospiraceae bacterium]